MQQVPLIASAEDEAEHERKSARLELLWPPSLKALARERARAEGRSLNDLVVALVREALVGREERAA